MMQFIEEILHICDTFSRGKRISSGLNLNALNSHMRDSTNFQDDIDNVHFVLAKCLEGESIKDSFMKEWSTPLTNEERLDEIS